MRRRLFAAGAAIALMLIIAIPAFAAGPTREAAPIPSPGDLEGFCPFPVHYVLTANNEYTLTFTDDGGVTQHIRTTGSLKAALSNPENGSSIDVNVSGPGHLLFFADDTTTLFSTGNWLLFWGPDQLGPGTEGSMVLIHGRIVIRTAEDGFHQQILSRSGTMQDVCAMLG